MNNENPTNEDIIKEISRLSDKISRLSDKIEKLEERLEEKLYDIKFHLSSVILR